MKTPMSYSEYIENVEIKTTPELERHIKSLLPKLKEVYLDFGHMHLDELANYYEEVLDALSYNTSKELHKIEMGNTELNAKFPFDKEKSTVNEKAILLLAMTAVSFRDYSNYMKRVIASNGKSDTPTSSPIVQMKKYL